MSGKVWNRRTSARNIITEPLGYLDMLKLMRYASKILPDSGGIQKEAYLLEVPCIILRENTEWVETLEEGWNVLVGADWDKIVNTINCFNPIKDRSDIFGRCAAKKIASVIGN